MALQKIQGLWDQFSLSDLMKQQQQKELTEQSLERGRMEMETLKANAARKARVQEIISGAAAQSTVGQSPGGGIAQTQVGPQRAIKQLMDEGFVEEAQSLVKPMMEQFKAIGDQDKYAAAEFWNKNLAPVTGQEITYSEPDDYSAPKEVIGKDGKPVLIQRNKRTNEWEVIEGFMPQPRSGEIIRTNADGTIEIIKGDIGPNGAWGALSKPTRTQAEKDLIGMQDEYDRALTTAKTFRPEYLEIGTKIEKATKMWGEKLGVYTPKGETKKELERYVDFKRNAIEDINMYIKRITGAQMSEKEADRIRLAKPDPGEGLFDGDSPTQFQGKMKSTIRSLRLGMARRNYLLKNGFTDKQFEEFLKNDSPPISLNQMSEIIMRDAESAYNKLKEENPNATVEEDKELNRRAFELAFAQYGA